MDEVFLVLRCRDYREIGLVIPKEIIYKKLLLKRIILNDMP